MLKVSDLHKSFGNITAVDGLSFEIVRGETFGLLGPNGAGKSTTINMISGIIKPDSGEIGINGDNDPTRPEVRQKLGESPQALAIYEELSAEENLRLFGRLYKVSGKLLKERVDQAVEFAMLEERRKDRVSKFSGGMKRRLNLACSLLHDPPVLLLDEPTVGVDPQSRNQIYESIEKLKSDGRTILYTTHYMEEATRLCDRVGIIDHGKILALDTVDRLIEEYGGLSKIEGTLEEIPADTGIFPGTIEGDEFRCETDDPMVQFQKLIEKGLRFRQVKIVRADLETVFLNLTGRRLRD